MRRDVPSPRFDGIRKGDFGDIHDAIVSLWRAIRERDADVVTRKATQSLQAKTLDQVGIVDATTEPDTEAGVARLWVDSTTGDLYVKFGDGTKQLLAPDDGDGLVSAITGTLVNVYGRDAFGRIRVSNPYTLWDCKQLHDNQPLLIAESITNTSGNATATHSTTDADVDMYVEAQDTIIRQSRRRFNYQPGKSQLVMMTGVLGAGGTGVKVRVGYFDENDGLFFELDGTTLYTVVRKGASDTRTAQSAWSEDVMDGTGLSGRTLNKERSHIFAIAFEWLSVGSIEFCLGFDGLIYPVHKIDNTNVVSSAYMSTPNLPIRYEILSGVGGASATLKMICSTVMSEGGEDPTGKEFAASLRDSTAPADCGSIGTRYAVAGIRLKSTHLDSTVDLVGFDLLELAKSSSWGWELMLNPTLANALTWTGQTNSAIEYATPDTANDPVDETYSSGGTIIASGFVAAGQRSVTVPLRQLVKLGSNVAGTPDELILFVTPHAINLDFLATMTWREAP